MTYNSHSPEVCVVCGQPQGEPHMPGCPVVHFTIKSIAGGEA